MEHMLLHWDDIMVCLIDELIEEEVIELNKIEDMRRTKEQGHALHLSDRSMYGKFHDYKSLDLHQINGIFEDYHQAEKEIKRFMDL